MSEHNYHFDVTMHCTGCSGAIERVLKKLEGVKSYEISLENQTADVVAEPTLEFPTVLEKLKKTGKEIKGATADGASMEI